MTLALVVSNDEPQAQTHAVPTSRYIFVASENPDTNEWACLWAIARFKVPDGSAIAFDFMSPEEGLPANEADGFEVVYMDKLEIQFQGNKRYPAPNFQKFCEKLLPDHDAALLPIIELAAAEENAGKIDPTSIHFYFKGLPELIRDETGEVIWEQVRIRVFEALDMVYNQSLERLKSEPESNDHDFIAKNMVVLENGIAACSLFGESRLRSVAFEHGAHVVMCTERQEGRTIVGIEVSDTSPLKLVQVVKAIREAESKKRGFVGKLSYAEATKIGNAQSVPGWRMESDQKFVSCGNPKKMMYAEEYTLLTPKTIFTILTSVLGRLAKSST